MKRIAYVLSLEWVIGKRWWKFLRRVAALFILPPLFCLELARSAGWAEGSMPHWWQACTLVALFFWMMEEP